ncbi:amino acid adenylation domain-containing protein [Nocardia sp. NPDC060259]|uniref:amino acid adenylation domain-containing protein n=1 Tax=Nocardia sp. NPDC060259 TaxID=3347088 RepID=UPI0036570ABD
MTAIGQQATLGAILGRGGTGDRIAVVDGGRTWTYAAMADSANRLARELIAHAVGPETVVVLALPRSAELVRAVCAVAATGAAILPMDLRQPQARRRYLLADSAATIGITTRAMLADLPAWITWLVLDDPDLVRRCADRDPAPLTDADRVRPTHLDQLAYVLYTSGSTGAPKSVAVTHRGLAPLVAEVSARLGSLRNARVLQSASPGFDIFVHELVLTFTHGATAIIVPPEITGGGELDELIAGQRVTHAVLTPGVLATLDPNRHVTLRGLVVGGDVSDPALVARWAPGRTYVNSYGPTETTVVVTAAPLVAGGPVVLGPVFDGWSARILDERLRPVPPGEPGELYLSGPGVARGYRRRPGATATRFVADPFDPAGARMYRTGDLVRVRADDGMTLEFLGRTDFQLKVLGIRLEPGEIDAVLTGHEAVRSAVTTGWRTPAGALVPVSYVTPEPGRAVDTGALLTFARERLAAHAVPAAVVVLDELPLTPVGKVDRAALPAPVFASNGGPAPTDSVERLVGTVIAGLLGVESVGVDDDFFALGGNSLLAAQLGARLAAATGKHVPVRTVFDAPTVARLAVAVRHLSKTAPRPPVTRRGRPASLPLAPAQQRLWVLNRLDHRSPADNIALAVRLRGPLSVAALGAAFDDVVERHEPLRTLYLDEDGVGSQHILPIDRARTALATVPLQAAELTAALAEFGTDGFDLTTELPLRTRLFALGEDDHVLAVVVHHISADGWSLGPLLRDLLGAYTAHLRQTGCRRASFPTAGTSADPALAAGVVPEADRVPGAGSAPEARRVLAADSVPGAGRVLAADPAAEADPAPEADWARGESGPLARALAPLPVSYVDYALAQWDWITHDNGAAMLDGQLRYWRARLAGLAPRLELPVDRPHPPVASGRGAVSTFEFDAELTARIRRIAVAHGATQFMVLHAILAVALARSGGGADIAIGTPVAGRAGPELDDLVGMFVNMVVLRMTVDPADPFTALLTRARDIDLGALANADIPFERVVEALDPPRTRAHHPLFQVVLTAATDAGTVGTDLGGLTVEPVDPVESPAKFDLQLTMSDPAAATIGVAITYATDLFDRDTIDQLVHTVERITRAVTANPSAAVGDIDLIDETGPVAVRAPASHRPDQRTLGDLFDLAAHRHRNAVAIRAGETTVTYGELDDRSAALARELVAAGAGPERRVAVRIPRSADLVVAIVGVVRSGAAYVPVDPDYPPDRIDYLLADARPVCVIASGLTVHGVDEPGQGSVARTEPVRSARAENVAYVIYTSGSTGAPKGVAVEHRQVVALLERTRRVLSTRSTDVWALFHSVAFDFSVWELWGALTTGATLVVIDKDTARSPEQLRELLVRERVSVLGQTPSAFAGLDDADARATGARLALRSIVFGGEALDPRRLSAWIGRHGASGPALVNMFGITETTVHVTHTRIATGAHTRAGSPVGRPLDGFTVQILDDRLRPVPTGVVGEIYVAGAQVTRGYLRRPGLTATRFVANPGSVGGVLYRSGDLGRWTREGTLEHFGRADRQVKIRGFRIEPAEVEVALLDCPGVGAAAVVVRDDPATGPQLVGYVVPGGRKGAITGGGNGAIIDAGNSAVTDGGNSAITGGGYTPLTGSGVRAQLRDRLPEHQVPAAVVVIDALPLTANGKLDLGRLPSPAFSSDRAYRAPRGPVEQRIAAVFAELLGRDRVGADDSFFDLGGNSMVATRLVARLRSELPAEVALAWLFSDPSPAGLARRIAEDTGEESALAPVLALRARGSGAPLFCVHPVVGLSWSFAGLSTELDCPLYGVQSPAIVEDAPPPESIDALAADYVTRIRAVQPHGPYRLLGWCVGGVIAHAMAVRLQDLGEQVDVLAMLDSFVGDVGYRSEAPVTVGDLLGQFGTEHELATPVTDFTPEDAVALVSNLPGPFDELTEERVHRLFAGILHAQVIGAAHRPRVFHGDLLFFTADRDDRGEGRAAGAWRDHIAGNIRDVAVDATHWDITGAAALRTIGPVLAAALEGWATAQRAAS